MPLVERKELARETHEREFTARTFLYDPNTVQILSSANVHKNITINLPALIVPSSIQIVVVPLGGFTPEVIKGHYYIWVDWTRGYTYYKLGTGPAKDLIPLDTAGDLGGVDVGNGLFRVDDGSYQILLDIRSVQKSVTVPIGSSLTVNGTDWLPYEIEIIITGFELNEIAQNTGQSEAQVSSTVCDPVSQSLYGLRPQAGEEQSDFIETQKQSIRVAEAIMWQKNKVLEASYVIPYSPQVKRGATVRAQNLSKGINILGIVKSVDHTIDLESGQAQTQITLRATEYIFRTALGSEERVDLRA